LEAVEELLQALRLEQSGDYHAALIMAKSGDRIIGGLDLDQMEISW
jgi:hypothetical protein